MPMKSWTDAARKLDNMVHTARRDPERKHVKRYGPGRLVIDASADHPTYSNGTRPMEHMDAIKLVQTWDNDDKRR